MPIHLFSSYHIFTNHLAPVSNKVIFVDFGCGPLTSGIAFWAAFAGYRDIIYLGIDSSQGMQDKMKEINRYGPYGHEPFFRKSSSILDYNGLHQFLDYYIVRGDQTQIIFNFCYFLASHTLDVNNLFNVLIPIVEKYNPHKMCMVYQNPNSSIYQENWTYLKDNLSTFRSHVTQPNVTRVYCDRLIQGGRQYANVYFDILSNESSEYSNNPYQGGPPWNS